MPSVMPQRNVMGEPNEYADPVVGAHRGVDQVTRAELAVALAPTRVEITV
jgi:hypothetical protein